MTAAEPFTIIVRDDRWRIGVVREGEVRSETIDPPADATTEQLAELARQTLEQLGYVDQHVVLAPASTYCLSATIPTGELERGNRRQAMGYLLEEHLPISAEDVVADYLALGSDQALGVCAEFESLGPLVSALEAVGVRVRHICPAPLLAAAYADETLDADAVLIRDIDEHASQPAGAANYDLVELSKHKPVRWWWLADDTDEMHERLASLTADADAPCRLVTIGCNGNSVPTDQAARFDPIATEHVDSDAAATLHAARLLEGVASPWIDLRTDRLAAPDRFETYRTPVMALITAAVLLCVVVIGVSWWRGEQYRQQSASDRGEQAAIYRELTGERLRNGRSPLKAVRDEHRKLSRLTGQAVADDDGDELPPAFSALDHLGEVLDGLPKDLRFRVLEINLEPGLIRLTGEARTHAEAERIVIALRNVGYDIDAPKTRSLNPKGVTFSFTAKPTPKVAVGGGAS